MKRVTRLMTIMPGFLLGAATCLAAQAGNLGRVDFPTSAGGEVQEHFIKGVLLLHNFEYDDAREEFAEAARLEPGFAMAYWGEALTSTHQVWVEQDAEQGRAALLKLAPTREARLAKAPTQREKDYLSAVELLYGEGGKVARDQAYADAMGRLAAKYPDDLEAAAFYAVALLGTCQGERRYDVYMRAAAVAEEVFAKNPQHPGAIHYLIHCYDDPIHAPLGLRPARVYADVAGGASHAQHMPSHIFVALGMWSDVISANQIAVAVADQRVTRKSLGPDSRNYHALLWLEYALLQEGRSSDADRVLNDIAHSAAQTRSARALGHIAQFRAVYAVETGRPAPLPQAFDFAKTELAANVGALTAEGLADAAAGRLDDARKREREARSLLAEAAAINGDSENGAAGMMSMAHTTASPADRKTAAIMIDQLHAVLLRAEGNKAEGLRLLAETTVSEDALAYDFGPPVPVKPAHELYAEALLADGKPQDAVKQFQLALARGPRRAIALRGLAKALSAAGDTVAAQRASDDLASFWQGPREK
jgi:hypothetical protein